MSVLIGILSDTHSYVHEGVKNFLSNCDEIWHCGDIGEKIVVEEFSKISKFRAVHGNIDYGEIKNQFKEFEIFFINKLKIIMLHIGGKPERYSPLAKKLLLHERPDILVCGHSHILKVMFDKKHNCLFINPGAAGKYGFHKHITAIRFTIEDNKPKNLEVYEAER